MKLKNFTFKGKNHDISYIETQQVKEGVTCDLYTFDNDETRDLAVVTVSKGFKTPLQRVLLGSLTLEGNVSGHGKLTVRNKDGKEYVYDCDNDSERIEIEVVVGQTMQWEATDSELVFYEICYPPYTDGRFKNLLE